MQPQKPLIFFDGICHLCNQFVDTILQKDHKAQFQFAPLQGETAANLLTADERQSLESIILWDQGRKYQRSEAILRILIALGGAYKIFALAYVLPTPFRDAIYNFIAKNRYAWFGQREFCRLPTEDERERLLP